MGLNGVPDEISLHLIDEVNDIHNSFSEKDLSFIFKRDGVI